ncbi:hypothetical protein LENED_006025 [Lentinula edodes]|uniref:Uncharacterized protein n=1 Tax=Lentinula edodes TaxID=5353 RepID=A0A1Q3EAJ8_LENED|nr:hypothetical protein LENED_006025 [Lentinula edodes]
MGVATSDLEKFSAHCRNWYFKQDEEAGRLMTQTMANLPPAQRAPYSRLQASIRSAYHRSVNARRNAEFRAHLSATHPGASLTPHARANPRGSDAQKERYQSFERFVRSWCSMGMPGPQPFFQALWAVMRLQTVPGNTGGAGRHRIEWEFDDAVLKEAAGKDFMLEAIDILKGVLAFEEAPSFRTSTPPSGEESDDATITHSRSQSSPFFPGRKDYDNIVPKRARAPSDPFLDTHMLSRSVGCSSSNMTSLLVSNNSEEPLVAGSALNEDVTPIIETLGDDSEEEYMRTWTSSDLTNPEYLNLVKVFPSHITRRTLPYFSIPSPKKPSDLEAGLDDAAEVPCSGPMVGKVVGGLDLFSGGDSYSVNLTDHVVFCILYILGPLALYLWLQTATDYTGLPVYRTLLIINHQTFYSCTLTMDVNPRKNVYGQVVYHRKGLDQDQGIGYIESIDDTVPNNFPLKKIDWWT